MPGQTANKRSEGECTEMRVAGEVDVEGFEAEWLRGSHQFGPITEVAREHHVRCAQQLELRSLHVVERRCFGGCKERCSAVEGSRFEVCGACAEKALRAVGTGRR